MYGTNTAPALESGRVIKDYTIGGVLGGDVFGYTYYATDRKGRRVVIREHLPCMFAGREDAAAPVRPLSEQYEASLAAFTSEAEGIRKLDHPNLVKVLDVFRANGSAYYAMPSVAGKGVAEWAAEGVDRVLLKPLLHKLLFALGYLHGHHLLHLNLKPSNILVQDDGEPVIIGFGGARRQMARYVWDMQEFAAYTAYELVDDRGEVGAWTDIYSLGAILYRIICGQCPPESFSRVVDDTLVPLARQERAVLRFGAELVAGVDEAMEMPPERRWRSVCAWQEALAEGLLTEMSGIPLEEAEPMYQRGEACFHGNGVEKDEELAVEYYRRAAEAGYIPALVCLGWCYYNGRGVRQNYKEAAECYRKAGKQGDATAQFNLGVCYSNGIGVERDAKAAARWYRKAAEQGDAKAQCNLGEFYYFGRGVERDYAEAVKWYRKAAAQGNAHAQCSLGYCCEYGLGMDKDVAEAVQWYKSAADQGNAAARNYLAFCYKDGVGVEQDLDVAVGLFRQAAEQGNAAAQTNLGLCYENGIGVERDCAEAVKWFQRAAGQGLAGAQNNLGECYFYGHGVQKDHQKAVELYRLAAEQGDRHAEYNLGFCYEFGFGVPMDDVEAAVFYRLSALHGNGLAKDALRRMGLGF